MIGLGCELKVVNSINSDDDNDDDDDDDDDDSDGENEDEYGNDAETEAKF